MAKGKKSNANQASVPTRVGIALIDGAQEVYNHRKGGADIFGALVASAVKRLNGGEQLSVIIGELKNRKTNEMEPARIVQVDPDLLAVLTKDVEEYQAGRSVSPYEVAEATERAEADLAFAKANNSGIDLTAAEAKLEESKTEFRRIVFESGSSDKIGDCRSAMNLAVEASRIAKQAVVDFLKPQCASLSKETHTEDKYQKVLDNLTGDLDLDRKALVEFKKRARLFRASARPANNTKPNDGHLTERVGTSFGRTGGYSGRR